MRKTLRHLKIVREYKLPLVVTQLEEGGFLARCPKLPGCMSEGNTISEALANALDVANNLISLYHQERVPIKLQVVKKSSLAHPLKFSFSLPHQTA